MAAAPLIAYYRECGLLREVYASGLIDEIFLRIREVIKVRTTSGDRPGPSTKRLPVAEPDPRLHPGVDPPMAHTDLAAEPASPGFGSLNHRAIDASTEVVEEMGPGSLRGRRLREGTGVRGGDPPAPCGTATPGP
ncbi:MAG: hypothetical protein A3K68_01075 [Euryarchaeota archaeon RBG_16_68_13]|nr:MAG: hypothetical protein A3K68_01075 [Euryarchaeota archaeon RBG_16_68_13]